jgi:hypothetical protein
VQAAISYYQYIQGSSASAEKRQRRLEQGRDREMRRRKAVGALHGMILSICKKQKMNEFSRQDLRIVLFIFYHFYQFAYL